MKQKFFVVKTVSYNGFPYSNIVKSALTFDDARICFEDTIAKEVKRYSEEIEMCNEFHSPTLYHNGDDKGNGISIAIQNEDLVMSKVMLVVDESKDTTTFQHMGDTDYSINVPIVDFMSHEENVSRCGAAADEDGNIYVPTHIIRRPCDVENPQDTQHVYDVYARLYENIEAYRAGDYSIYAESLEEIPLIVLYNIFEIV
ncbi:MAG: hypothetical protein II453_17325 [Alphaproteobacteria bacterium]|nr:hypothetical protein [Alphaproteobacteria bacterium]